MKLCIDCKYHYDVGFWEKKHACGNEKCGSHIDPIDGLKVYKNCHHARAANAACGPEGKLWEAKE